MTPAAGKPSASHRHAARASDRARRIRAIALHTELSLRERYGLRLHVLVIALLIGIALLLAAALGASVFASSRPGLRWADFVALRASETPLAADALPPRMLQSSSRDPFEGWIERTGRA